MSRLACITRAAGRWLLALPLALLALPAFAETPAEQHLGVDEIVVVRDAIEGFIVPLLEAYAPWLLIGILGTELWRFAALFLTIALFAVLRRGVVWLTLHVMRRLTARTPTDIDDQLVEAINPPIGYFVVATGIYLGLFWPNFSPATDHFIDISYRIAVITLVGWAALRAVHILTGLLSALAAETESELDDHLVPLIGRIVRVLLIALIGVFALQEFGFNVAGLLAGLGVGGLAFALAAQDTVANWFGALMIYTDRPFKIGDWIKTPQLEGVVEEIGLRSTRVRTFAKSLVSVPNSDLAGGTIENWSRMPLRRVYFKLGLSYRTTPDQMREVLAGIHKVVEEHEGIDQTFWMVKFDEFGQSSLNILIYYFTVSTAWGEHLSVREDVNLKFMEVLDRAGVTRALPSHAIVVEQPMLDQLDAAARAAMQAGAEIDTLQSVKEDA